MNLFRLLVSLVAVLGFALIPPVASAADGKPNVVFILTDDTGYGDLSANGHPLLKTPNLDRLSAEAVRFTDFHVSPTCAPTRSALLTGRHEFKNGVTHTILERERLTPEAATVPQILKNAGYTTGIFGKWHLGDEPTYWPDKRGFDEVFIHGGGGIGQSYPGSCGDAPGNKYFNPAILHNGRFEKTTGFCTDIFTNEAIRWMEGVKGKQPFFCYIPFNAAHAPLSCPPQYKAPYEGKVPDAAATFFGMIANIDENVGRVLSKLEEWNIAKDTIVIFMNDNGGTFPKVFNAGMRGSKVTPWNGGTRAVSLWRWPGTWTPREAKGLAAHLDFFPTLAEITGATLDDRARTQIEGRSLVPLLKDANAPWLNRTLFTHVGRWPKGADPEKYKYTACSVRNGNWHLVSEAPGAPKPREKGWQLFDLNADPGEQKDVAGDNPEIVARMDAEYDRWWAAVVPMMVNEKAEHPGENPFKELYRQQFGAER